ncbi:hypothetical protein PV327_002638 [Microctonus hyperodae]|uniref:Uncharacterized protein n=1 Tax=Microctonus hyperodae TaxID=165561 RepID=A0AA39FG44_MICHY|nr:hypothetical protein PV327_002638 [Microctonus hyperodae]
MKLETTKQSERIDLWELSTNSFNEDALVQREPNTQKQRPARISPSGVKLVTIVTIIPLELGYKAGVPQSRMQTADQCNG